MVTRIASLAAIALLLVTALCPAPAAAQAPAEPPSGEAVDNGPAAEDAALADSTGGEAEDGSGQPDAEPGTAEETESADPGWPDREAAPEPEVVAPSGLRVFRAYICKGIEQSEPTEAGKSFIPAADGVLRLCCFSEIGGAARPDTVFHVWYWGEREMARVSLRVQGARWRTWSTKRIVDDWQGDWRVDIVDRDGFVLNRLPFSVE